MTINQALLLTLAQVNTSLNTRINQRVISQQDSKKGTALRKLFETLNRPCFREKNLAFNSILSVAARELLTIN